MNAKWSVDLSGGLTRHAVCIECGGQNLETTDPGECECRDCGCPMSVEEANEKGGGR